MIGFLTATSQYLNPLAPTIQKDQFGPYQKRTQRKSVTDLFLGLPTSELDGSKVEVYDVIKF